MTTVLGAFKSAGKLAWSIATAQPPRPSLSDQFVQKWAAGTVVPPSLKFQNPETGAINWPLLQVARYEGRSTVFRIEGWGGQTTAQIRQAFPQIESALGYKIWKVVPDQANVRALFFWAGFPPSFDDVQITPAMKDLYPADRWDWSAYVGWTVDGQPGTLAPGNTSSLLVTGLPGSGKTVLIRRILTEWRMAGARVRILDFKGGGDYVAFAGRGIPVVGDLAGAVDLLEDTVKRMDNRIRNMGKKGVVNFWDYREPDRPGLSVVVIDECQTLFETSGVSKEEKQLAERARTLVADLCKRGRSAGFYTVLSTQKSDSTAIPTRIRDVCERRISGRQTTPQAAMAALGYLPPDEYRPDNPAVLPPDRPGRMVIVGQTTDPVVFQTAPMQ